MGFRYQMTFIDEVAEPTAEVIRAKSCPPVLKTPKMTTDATSLGLMHEQERLALQVSKLQERSQLLSTFEGAVRPNDTGARRGEAIPSLGSYGHPNICRRPCILMMRGTCQKGADCGFCHLAHEARIPSFDKQQRDFLKLLPPVTFLEMILPYVRKTVEASELPGACRVLQLLESEIVVRATGGTTVQRTPRKIRYVLERMSLANLVSLICSTLRGNFSKLMSIELKDLRETTKILEF
mmetsp:Transcript_10662/g.23472  ORF Transcript_10662/g.23472 Transcript_10662/m.23472 type:complete len:238 (-) Transcript_10662:41-754(-)